MSMGFSTMAALTSSASTPETENSDVERSRSRSNKSEPLIPGLPDEVAELCLVYLPYPYQALVRSVSASWRRAISDPAFLHCKKSLSLPLPYLFVFAFNKSTARIQWQALDPRSGRWFVLPPMPGHYSKLASPPGLACASLPRQGMLVVLGGSDAESSMRSTIVYRTSTNQWSSMAPMPTARSYFDAGTINNKIVAVGGSGTRENDSIRAIECYNPENDTWATLATMPVGLAKYDSHVVGDKMYVTEGWTWPFMFSPRGLVYDSKTDAWRDMSPGMREGWTGVSVVVGNKLLVISEYGDCPMKVYDHDKDTWRYVGGDKFPCDSLRRPFAVSAVEGSIYVVACGLNVGIGRLSESEAEKGELQVEWQVLPAPSAFRGFSPSSCEVLYA
ncbi:putative F-box domain, kelch-type beta propeller [Rosa chinensis]|uniref:Putative F-box domain, kelch-type beta propeller n=1 Tax=Rosa chinensis TaxID=74649 RepID=A0A2P6PZR3_ROSCH|nr:F-box protein AFR [Rosa chinensis]PRQ27411.1 putative F-box domain, kelch-type beta propeller [Rosa chinensis]